MEPIRSPLHRLAPIVLAVLGVFGALLTIFAGLVALNHTVLPFKGWPLDGERLNAGTQVLPRAPVVTGRLRTAPGGALAVALGSSSPLARAAAVPALTVTPHVTILVRHRASHPVSHTPAAKPPPVPAPVTATPVPAPAPVAATPAPAVPVAIAVVPSPAPIARRPVTGARLPGTATTSTAPGNGHGNGAGRAHAPGQLKKTAIAAAAPPSAAVPVAAPAAPAPPAAGTGPGNGHGHGPPPWAHGHH